MWSGNPETISLYYLDRLRSTGLELDNLRDLLSPAGIPVRLTFETKLSSNGHHYDGDGELDDERNERRGNVIRPEIEILSDRSNENNQWQAYVSSRVFALKRPSAFVRPLVPYSRPPLSVYLGFF